MLCDANSDQLLLHPLYKTLSYFYRELKYDGDLSAGVLLAAPEKHKHFPLEFCAAETDHLLEQNRVPSTSAYGASSSFAVPLHCLVRCQRHLPGDAAINRRTGGKVSCLPNHANQPVAMIE